MIRQFDLINTLVAQGKSQFSFRDALEVSGTSASSTGNALGRLRSQGLIDRVVQGHYIVRPFGSLGTRAVSEDLATAVGIAFEGRRHRIAYRSALAELGFLQHPVRTVVVASDGQARFQEIDGRPLRVVIERPKLIEFETETVGRSRRSSANRALFECAMRVDLAGGVTRLAEALVSAASDLDPAVIESLGATFGARGSAAIRRLSSLALALGLDLRFPSATNGRSTIRLDPRDPETLWLDDTVKVIWGTTADELRASVLY